MIYNVYDLEFTRVFIQDSKGLLSKIYKVYYKARGSKGLLSWIWKAYCKEFTKFIV